jgi:hypothetical protein
MSSENTLRQWQGFILDTIIIVSLTTLTALHLVQLTVLLAVIGPMVGARLSALRQGGGGPAAGAGSAIVAVVLGLSTLFRRWA